MQVIFSDQTRMECEDQPFTAGAEGSLYFSKDKNYVIKLYLHPDHSRLLTLQNILGKYNLVKDDPSRTASFGWPDNLVISPQLGIRMPRVKDCVALENYVLPGYWKSLPAAKKGSWQMRLIIAHRMARILRWMHGKGLCHSDLSPKNFMINIKTGQTTLIDCDGLVVPGIQPPSVLGTKGCMAPEIVMGKATPTIDTDKHALAVLIYRIFLFRNPLEGPKVNTLDPEKDEELSYGSRALYIEHPTDRSNRPKNFPFTAEMLTPFVRKLFQQTFVDGLHDPKKRPPAAKWEEALLRMADRIVPCQNPACEMKSFVVPDTHNFKCPWCGAPYRSPAGMPILSLYRPGTVRGTYTSDDWSIAAFRNRPVYVYHADTQKLPEPSVSSAVVAHFDTNIQGKWFLVNDGLDDLRSLETEGSSSVKRGGQIELKPGTKILLGHEEKCRLAYVQMLSTN